MLPGEGMHQFDQAIQSKEVQSLEQGVTNHIVDVSTNFSIVNVPNGGYLMALLARQMLDQSDKSTTPIITVNFLTRTGYGDAQVRVSEISRSRQFNRYEALLIQNGDQILKAMGSFMADGLDCPIDRYEANSPEVASIEDCVEMPKMPNFTIYDEVDVRLDPDTVPWLQGKTGTKSEHRGWIRFADDRDFDLCGILLASDAFPPPIFATEGVATWVPTIEMSVNIRNLPVSKWLKCRFRTKHITCGLLEEDGELWDEAGNLVAISRQIAQFRR